MSYDDYETRRRLPSLPMIVAGLAVLAAVGVSLFAYASVQTQSLKVDLLETDVRDLEGRLEDFRLADQQLEGRVKGAEGKLRQKDAGQAPLAAKILKSVFTVETRDGLGAGFAGWVEDGQLYVVTAAHVVSEVGEQVKLERNNGCLECRGRRGETRSGTSPSCASPGIPSAPRRSGRSRCATARGPVTSCCWSAARSVSAARSRVVSSAPFGRRRSRPTRPRIRGTRVVRRSTGTGASSACSSAAAART